MSRRFLAIIMVAFAWLGAAGPASAGVDIKVDLTSQRMKVRTAAGESFDWAISSGRQGYRTPNGVYRPQRLEKRWHSRKYGGAMPNAVFFRGGYAIHGTTDLGRLGRPASHGCVRLHPANAAKLFALVQRHGKGATRIAINGVAPDSLSQFAKARGDRAKVAAKGKPTSKLAVAKRQKTDWTTARGRMLERADGFFEPGAALGFQPLDRTPGHWRLRR
jgi:hypothetical protein